MCREQAIVVKLLYYYTVYIIDNKYIMIDQYELYRKDYPVLQYEKQYRKEHELWLKVKKIRDSTKRLSLN